MALFPAKFILLYLPSVYDIAYEIQSFTSVMFEEIIKLIGFAIFSA
jgi:hypothetical protein